MVTSIKQEARIGDDAGDGMEVNKRVVDEEVRVKAKLEGESVGREAGEAGGDKGASLEDE